MTVSLRQHDVQIIRWCLTLLWDDASSYAFRLSSMSLTDAERNTLCAAEKRRQIEKAMADLEGNIGWTIMRDPTEAQCP